MCRSALPGLNNAGSNFSLWLVVINRILPSAVLTPSKAFNKPLKEILFFFDWSFSLYIKIASTSSSKTIDLFGIVSKASINLSSVKLSSYKDKMHKFNLKSPTISLINEVFPVPGGPYNK